MGKVDGTHDGVVVGQTDGESVGVQVGVRLGRNDSDKVDTLDGALVVGCSEGLAVGDIVVGICEGTLLGAVEMLGFTLIAVGAAK